MSDAGVDSPVSNGKLCAWCGGDLVGRQSRFCSPDCSKKEARRARLEAQFSITPDEYEELLLFQGGGCGICGRPPKEGKRLAVDHDHNSGVVRGLLCFFCNKRVLGARSAEVLVKTAAYVSDPPGVRVLGMRIAAGRPPKKRRPRAAGAKGGRRSRGR